MQLIFSERLVQQMRETDAGPAELLVHKSLAGFDIVVAKPMCGPFGRDLCVDFGDRDLMCFPSPVRRGASTPRGHLLGRDPGIQPLSIGDLHEMRDGFNHATLMARAIALGVAGFRGERNVHEMSRSGFWPGFADVIGAVGDTVIGDVGGGELIRAVEEDADSLRRGRVKAQFGNASDNLVTFRPPSVGRRQTSRKRQ